jgi:hypothetical protein
MTGQVVVIVRQHHVDPIEAIGIGGHGAAGLGGFRLFGLGLALEESQVVEDAGADGLEVVAHFLVLVFEVFDDAVDQHRSGFFLQQLELKVHGPLELERLAVNGDELLLELLLAAAELAGLGFVHLAAGDQLVEALHRNRLALQHRDHAGAHAADFRQREALLLQLFGESVEHLLFLRAVALQDTAAGALVLLAFQDLREAGDEEVDGAVHVLAEAGGLAAREVEQARLLGALEVVDIAAIGRGRAVRRDALQHFLHGAEAAGAAQPADEDVVAGAVELDAEAKRLDGAVLADDAFQRLEVGGGLETEAGRVAVPAQLLGEHLAKGAFRFFQLVGHSPSQPEAAANRCLACWAA